MLSKASGAIKRQVPRLPRQLLLVPVCRLTTKLMRCHFDLENDINENILTSWGSWSAVVVSGHMFPIFMRLRRGFLKCLLNTMRLRPDGLLAAGVPCSSFVWVNLATSLRNGGCVFGDETRGYVQEANQIACRAALLFLIAIVRSVQWSVEQPRSSRLFQLPYFEYLHDLCLALDLPIFKEFLHLAWT